MIPIAKNLLSHNYIHKEKINVRLPKKKKRFYGRYTSGKKGSSIEMSYRRVYLIFRKSRIFE